MYSIKSITYIDNSGKEISIPLGQTKFQVDVSSPNELSMFTGLMVAKGHPYAKKLV